MKKLHVISHTHWDREWYLTFQQFRLKLVHLIDKLLKILEEDPDFKFFMLDGQTIVLDDYLYMRPENEDILRQYIQSGRILIGPWHILPDMFLVSPEGHIRNLLQGASTARKFGPKMPVGYIPDPFGHPGQIPQILKGFGLDVASLWRGVSGDYPAELWWESPDGSKVLLAYLRDSYSNGAYLPANNSEQFAELISEEGESLAAHSAVSDYLIMLGTDHMEPSPFTSRAIAYANQNLPDTEVIHSTIPDYVQAISEQISGKKLPTLSGELRACDHSHLLPGVLSTRMWIKQRNQHSQTLLEKWAEPFSVFAEHLAGEMDDQTKLVDRPIQEITSDRIGQAAPLIRQVWRMLMENHPHDSICGCSIDQVHEEMRPRFDQVDQIGEELTRQSLQALAVQTDTRKDGAFSAVVLFNPYGHANQDMVEAELNIPTGIEAYELVDQDGSVLPHEFIGANNEQYANVLLGKDSLRDTIGAVAEGRVAGMAITRVVVSRTGDTVTIDAILDSDGEPNIGEWQRAEEQVSKYETDPGVKNFHVLAHSPMSSKVRFVSPEIPGLGWRTVWLREAEAADLKPAAEINPLIKPFLPLALRIAQSELGGKLLAKLSPRDETKPPFVIENENFSVEASEKDGTLTITDKQTGVVYSGLNRFVDGGDAGDEYNYSPPAKDEFCIPDAVSVKVFRDKLIPSLEILYDLEVPASLSADRKRRSNEKVRMSILSRVSLVPGTGRIDIHTELENPAKDHRLRVHFPAPVSVSKADYDGHFEVVRRAIGVPEKGENWVEDPRPEVPQRAFTDVSNGEFGLMIANRGLPEVEVLDVKGSAQSEIALTLLRSVGWLSRDDMPVRAGHAGPAFETPGAQVPGRWSYEYAIIPHRGTWKSAYLQAYSFETALRAVGADLHVGKFSSKGSYVSHSPAEFVITAIKETEDGSGWLVRGFNISSDPIQLDIQPLRKFSKAEVVNLAEDFVSELQISADGSVQTEAAGHKILSIKFS